MRIMNSYNKRTVPPLYDPKISYHAIFEVAKPLTVKGSLASPCILWKSPGGGYQFVVGGGKSASQLIDEGCINLFSIKIGY